MRPRSLPLLSTSRCHKPVAKAWSEWIILMPPPFVGYTSNIKHTHIIPKPSYIRYSLLNILNFSCKKKQSPSYVNHLNKPYFKKTSPRCVPVIRTSTNLGETGKPQAARPHHRIAARSCRRTWKQRSHRGPLVFAVKTPEFQVTKKQKAKKTRWCPIVN